MNTLKQNMNTLKHNKQARSSYVRQEVDAPANPQKIGQSKLKTLKAPQTQVITSKFLNK